jgi:TonB family protein
MKITTNLLCWILLCYPLAGQAPAVKLGLRSFVAPQYPAVARQARIEGEVRLSVSLDKEGRVAYVDSAEGPEILVAEARSNVVSWSYTSSDHLGKVEITYVFALKKPEKQAPPIPRIELVSPTRIVITSNLPRMVG